MKKNCCTKKKSPKPKQKQRKTKTPPSNKLKHKKVVIKSQKQKQYEKVTKSLNQKPTITFGNNNNQEHREYLTTFINIILDAISDKSYVIASSESIILNNIIQSLSQNNKIRILLQTDKEWCEFLLKEKIIHYKLESIISSLRADLLQEQYIDTTNESSSSSNKENNILQQLQSFLQYMNDTKQDTTNSILNMMNICSLCLLKPKCKKTSSILYFVIESYAKLVFHYINITTSTIKREDKLVTFSNVISSLDNAHKLKFCAYFLRLWKQQQQEKDIDDDCMIWHICKIIQMASSSSSCPRLIGNTIDQLNKFIDWSNDVLNLPTNHEDSDHSVDGVNEDNVNNNKLLDTSAYDHYLLSDDDDDDSTESSSDSLDEEEEDDDNNDNINNNDDDDDESMKEHDSDSSDVEEEQEVKDKKNDK